MAYGGASAIALGGLAGPFGCVRGQAPWPQPYFDQAGGVFPVYHARRALGALAGARLHHLSSSKPRDVMGLAAKTGQGVEVLLANLTGEAQHITLSGLGDAFTIARLDAAHFVSAAQDPTFFEMHAETIKGPITLDRKSVV